MMKKIITAVSLMLFLLAGCAKPTAAGSWRLIEISDESSGMYISEENLAGMGVYTMQLYEDGSGQMNMAGQLTNLKWDAETITLTASQPQYYTMEGSQLRLQDQEAVLVFVRDN
ncbi:MAG: hypothetical protein IKG53_04190 [Solobacterium sp.]|nr:hypothetical protein [Solobacterium sp.]